MSSFITRVEREKEEPFTVIFTTDDHSKYIRIANECRKLVTYEESVKAWLYWLKQGADDGKIHKC